MNGWREELFGSPLRSTVSMALIALLGWMAWTAGQWTMTQAVFRPDAEACRAAHGACWGVIAEKWRPLLFGRYPYAEQWRAALALALLMAMLLASAWPRLWRPALALLWGAALALFALLMHGGLFGLSAVPANRWGGLPLTVSLAAASLALAFPLAVLLALARRSRWPVPRSLAATYIELVRGVPLISVLFMASFLLPLLWPTHWRPDVLTRVLAGLTLFVAAYFAEIIRGGLQAVPRGQIESALALGLSRWQVQRHVVLPQALRMVVPALMNSVIGTLKDTSLVTVVGLFELTGALSLALGGDPLWRPFYLEGYLFIALLYWLMCFGLSRYGAWIERRLAAGVAASV
ncbi:MAG: amino acid ABC transporter permease [Burkholderiaceae bacterium]|jgi:general L-amino acid transport system permease protein|nr:amino acid ABC transporter permease [Burkholderiaceae bacterium]